MGGYVVNIGGCTLLIIIFLIDQIAKCHVEIASYVRPKVPNPNVYDSQRYEAK